MSGLDLAFDKIAVGVAGFGLLVIAVIARACGARAIRLDAAGYWGSLLSAADVTNLWNGGAGTEFYGGVWH